MGRMTGRANRGIDRVAGGRNAGTGWYRMMKPFLLVGLVLASFTFLSTFAGNADAATNKPPKQRVACHTDISWRIDNAYAPADVNTSAAVTWAYGQVAEPSDTYFTADDLADVEWAWQSPRTGPYRPGESYRAEAVFRSWWVHGLDAQRDWSTDALREHVLRGILTDFGVESPNSTGAGLTVEDGNALAQACKRHAAKDGDKSSSSDGLGAVLYILLPDGTNLGTRGFFGASATADKMTFLGAVVPLGLFLIFGERLLTLAGRKTPRSIDAAIDGPGADDDPDSA